ncbi:MAG: hypothetical protein Q8865_10310 [Bacillota bacterium]|nr:hypothetical protein [Bacillota bacterium]
MMMNKKKKIITGTLIAVVVIIAIPLGLYIAGNTFYSDTRIYEQYWKINVPRAAKEKYNINTPTSFHGDGYRFTSFELKSADSPLLSGASNDKSSSMQNEVTSILDSLNAEKKQYPNFNHTYLWKSMSQHENKLYIIYDKDLSMLYFAQQTM